MHDPVAAVRRTAHPIVFLVLYLPFGMSGGYFSGALGNLLSNAGVSTVALGGIMALSVTPHTFKVLWAPLVDTTFSVKGWFVLSTITAAISVAATGFLPMNAKGLAAITALVLATSIATTFSGMSCESLMANSTSPDHKGRAGGWSQAGNVGGVGLGGAIGLALAANFKPVGISSCVVGALMAVTVAVLVFLPEPDRGHRRARHLASLWVVTKECWQAVASRAGVMTLLIFVLPIGTSTASNFFSAVARQWRASPNLVAGLAGVASLATIGGAIGGGWICDRMDRRAAYGLFGVIQAVVAVGMAVGPRTPASFIVFALAYAATVGLTYAAFAAVTLDVIGVGAAATKFNLFACVSNVPILYMNLVEGWSNDRWRAGGLLMVEAALATGAVLVFAGLALATRRGPQPALAT
jgi:PAT family beta-lactamase induction signal transducer AmpG